MMVWKKDTVDENDVMTGCITQFDEQHVRSSYIKRADMTHVTGWMPEAQSYKKFCVDPSV